MNRGSLTLFRVRGIPIRAHWSLLLALVYVTVAFSGDFTRMTHLADVSPGPSTLPPLAWGAVLAVGLFVSVVLHELAHSLFAIRTGGRVREITLMVVGGVSRIEKMPRSLRLEGWMALVGPLSSFAIAGVLWLVRAAAPAEGGWDDLRLGLFYLASMNLTLGIFNLLPAFPMDGGRVLRALLAEKLGRPRATRLAVRVGQLMSIAFGLFGLLTSNVLLILIAFFLFSGASAEGGAEALHTVLGDLKVKDLMTSRPLTVRTDQTLAEVGAAMRDAGRADAVVLDERQEPVGVIQAQDLARAGESTMRVEALVSVTSPRALEIAAEEPIESSMTRGLQQGARYLLVVDRTTQPPSLIGLVGPTEIQNAIAMRGLLAKGTTVARR